MMDSRGIAWISSWLPYVLACFLGISIIKYKIEIIMQGVIISLSNWNKVIGSFPRSAEGGEFHLCDLNPLVKVRGLTSVKRIVLGTQVFQYLHLVCVSETSLWEKHLCHNLVVLLSKSVRTVILLLRLCDPLASRKLFNEVSIWRKMTDFQTSGKEYYMRRINVSPRDCV